MKVQNIKIYGLKESIKASGYPMRVTTYVENGFGWDNGEAQIQMNDTVRAKKLGCAIVGSGHDNFLNGIIAQFDLTCSNKMWTEFQRYHFADFVSSCSTIHTLTKTDISEENYHPYTDSSIVEIMKSLKKKYEEEPNEENFLRLVYSNPSGFNLTARITTNYRQLKTMYYQRKSHKLKEWRDFCDILLKDFEMFSEICISK